VFYAQDELTLEIKSFMDKCTVLLLIDGMKS